MITRAGDDFVIQLRFDASQFVGRSAPLVAIDSSGVIGATVASSVAEVLLGSQVQDDYTSNAKDAGMRIKLPGEAGTRNLYHVRVRSSNTRNPLDFATLNDPNLVGGGLSQGRYELQIRLQEGDESPGTQVRLADIRYATTGLQIIGQPFHSPLLGEEYETSAANDSLANAQPLGYFGVGDDLTAGEAGPLQSDRLAKSFAGVIDSATDVDWYSFEINYENLTRDAANLYLSTVFDLDYASNFARSDMALYVFNAAGQLVLVGGDANIADDLPGTALNNDTSDLSRGSAGTEDPYIGAAELSEGTYFVAVANQQQVPLPMDQFFNANSANPLLRLEPIDSVRRIAEDRIGTFGGGTASAPVTPVLFDNNSIVEYSFDDTLLYVNTVDGLFLVNPFTGENYGNVGDLRVPGAANNEEIRDIAFRANGELFAYSGFANRQRGDQNWFYYRIDTTDASLSAPLSAGAGITTYHDLITVINVGNIPVLEPTLDVTSDDGLEVEAISIREFQDQETGFFVGNRPITQQGLQYINNILYEFNDATGLASGPIYDRSIFAPGAGTSPREIGQINTLLPAGTLGSQLGVTDATEVNSAGIAVPSLVDGDTFTLTNVTETVTFELDQSYTLTANGIGPVRDGDLVIVDSVTFEFNTGQRFVVDEVAPAGLLAEGATTTVTSAGGQTATFEFVRSGQTASAGIPIFITGPAGLPRAASLIAADLAAAINANVVGVDAAPNNNEIFFTGNVAAALSSTGAGVSILGSSGLNNAGAFGVNVSETVNSELLIARLAAAIRSAGIAVSDSGTQLSLPTAVTVTVQPVDPTLPSALALSGSPGVSGSNLRILLLPTDSADDIAQRISAAVQVAADAGILPNVSAIPQGRSLRIDSGFVVNASGNLTAGGVSPQRADGTVPLIQGIEIVGDSLFAVSDTGGLFRVDSSQLTSNGNRQVGQYVATATDLVGINFTGLRAGPASVEDGSLSQILFGVTASGDMYAFDTAGELQPVFAGGRSMISTGIGGALGLDFSTIDFNLWHVTDQRDTDAGHGINANFSGTRGAVGGGNSLAFNYENLAFAGNFPSPAEQPTAANRQDGTPVEATYNVPGGTKGVVQSNPFSLSGYGAADEPVMYFNYFSQVDGNDDRLRVYVLTEDGAQHLVASNTTVRFGGTPDDEFDDPAQVGSYDDDIDVDVQQLFDNTGTWRQARVPLSEFAGEANLSLRIEFSTGGIAATSSPALRTLNADALIDGQEIVINGETFSIDFAPAIAAPSGVQLATLYADPTATATVTIDGQTYVLDDGTRTVGPGEVAVDLFGSASSAATLSDLTAIEIADAIAQAVRLNLPANELVTGFDFSDPSDNPLVGTGRNDLIYEATALPYTGGNVTIDGSGRIGQIDPVTSTLINLDDVDLLRVDVEAGSTVAIDAQFDNVAAFLPIIRFFDANGDEVQATTNSGNGRLAYVTPVEGPVFIGISGPQNDNYDPRLPGTAVIGQVDTYTASITINTARNILTAGSVVEFNGLSSVTANPANLINVTGHQPLTGIPIHVSRLMTADQVAAATQLAIANRFTQGDLNFIPTYGSVVTLPTLSLQDSGPFARESERYGDQYGTGILSGVQDNVHEGIYLDDFIIGFAERGELATGSDVVSTPFVTDLRPQFPLPADPTSNLQTGSYQVEIRDASEYVNSGTSTQFRTFDTNDRLTDSRLIVALPAHQLRDGSTFSIFDGRSTVTFEFDLVESATGVTPGHVQVPYTLSLLEPGTEEIDLVTGLPIPGSGTIRPQTAAEVAQSIIDAINRPDVQTLIDASALRRSGVDGTTDAAINLFGKVLVQNDNGALASLDRESLRGDDNRDRDSQGVILVENSRFLFNEEYGIEITHDVTADVDGNSTLASVRYPRNLVELNSESLKPGVVIQSNVFSFNGTGGLEIAGIDPTLLESGSDPVPFERITNNTFIGGSISLGRTAPSATFEGILFDQGLLSFADAVVDYSPDAGNGPPTFVHQTPNSALGAPDGTGRGPEPIDGTTAVSLGLGGNLTLQFTDNLLTGSGDARPDLVVFEVGAVESVLVEISRDGVSFTEVGIVGGLTNQLDIDAAGFGVQDRFAFVRLTDLRQGDPDIAPLGADIDSVGALSTVPVDTYTAGGTGINIVGNAAPTLLNNVIANSEVGIEVDPTNAGVVLGGNSFYRNTANLTAGVSMGEFAQVLGDAESVFVAPAELIYAPAAGASIIDSSIDSLEDRSSLTTVRNPLGLPPSPILAPRLDVNGQLRVDDPDVETPSGLGERVFKDRGASDRGDLVGPRAVLLTPAAPNLGISAGTVSVFGQAPRFFEIQLIDGLAPADVVPGTGLDDRTISSDALLLLKDNIALVEGVDYRFSYNLSTNVIRLTPIAGVWESDSTYVVRLIDDTDAIVAASDGDTYTDADRLNVLDLQAASTAFEYETGITITLSESLTAPFADGITLDIFDGMNLIEFELDNDQAFDADRIPLVIPQAASAERIAAIIADTINQTPALNLIANVSGTSIQLLGSNPLAYAQTGSFFVNIVGEIGTSIGFGIQIPADGAAPADTIDDGQVFIVRRGAVVERIFELDNNNLITTPGAIAVTIPVNATLDNIADAIVRAVGGAGLGLSPENAGFGRVFLGGDRNYNVDLSASVFTQIANPGDVATIPIVVGIDQTASQIAMAIADAINNAALPGVSTTIVDSRVFVEGTGGVSGTGAVDLITIADEVGNQLQSNQANGRTELSIFIGGGFDYGDAPSPYLSLDVQGGPRHAVDPTFALGNIVTPETNALVPNGDDDDGISVGTVQAGFIASFTVNITNQDNRIFYLDAWFDWDGDGQFEFVRRVGSAGSGRLEFASGGQLVVQVPASATLGERYARFRLSEDSNLGPNGDASSGEVEDFRFVVTNNPYQNPTSQFDVNDSGDVTPLDALQVINAMSRNDGNPIDLSLSPLPPRLPPFPDVSGNGLVTAQDALMVINELGRIANFVSGSGELVSGLGESAATSFLPTGGGVFASGATVIGDALLSQGTGEVTTASGPVSTIAEETEEHVSVFDHPAVVELDEIVDALAEDKASKDDSGETSALDQLFASL